MNPLPICSECESVIANSRSHEDGCSRPSPYPRLNARQLAALDLADKAVTRDEYNEANAAYYALTAEEHDFRLSGALVEAHVRTLEL